MRKDSFLIYKDFYEPIRDLTDEQLGRLFRSIFEYQISGEPGIPDADIRIPFKFFLNQFRIDDLKYEKRCEANRENGKKGGRPITQKTHSDKSEPKKPDTDTDTDNHTGNDNGTDKKTDKKTIVFPFDSDRFKSVWSDWKSYRSTEHGFKYKSHISEQTALKKLYDLSGGSETNALLIMEQSVENGWKGFFELKKKQNQQGSDIDSDYINELKNRLS